MISGVVYLLRIFKMFHRLMNNPVLSPLRTKYTDRAISILAAQNTLERHLTFSSNCPRLQVIQSKCLPVIGNHFKRTPSSHLHYTLHIQPIPPFIHRLIDKFFAHCPLHPNPLFQHIGNCTVADLTNLYKKYKHKRTKHILL